MGAGVHCRPIQEKNINPSFNDLGLLAELLRAVEAQGYTQPTPIQQQAIPVVLAGRDLLAAAQTGTGKTAGFVLPILQRLTTIKTKGSPDGRRPPRVLILTPTRELAAQVEESVRTYGAHLSLRSTVVFGGVGMQPQVQALRRGVEILVATPGRLLDHAQQNTVDLSRIEILVLDEADRMLDMGFIRDIRRVLALLPAQRQNLLFSATFSDEIRELAHSFLKDPATVEVARRNATSDLVKQVVHPVDQARKRELLAHLIGTGGWEQVLVFTRTKHGANRLAEQLTRDGISASAIHGNKSQSNRTRTLADFKAGELRVLVATDIAARGLDIEELPHVVNFDLSHVAEDYVHRIGRTGRAGALGEAVSLVSAEDEDLLKAIERLVKHPIERRVVPGFEPGARGTAASDVAAQTHRAGGGQRKPGQQRRGDSGQRRGDSGERQRSARTGDAQRNGSPGRPSRGSANQGERVNERNARGGESQRRAQNEGSGETRTGAQAGAARRPRRDDSHAAGQRGAQARSGTARSAPKDTPRPAAGTRSAAREPSKDGQKRGAFASLLAGARRLIG